MATSPNPELDGQSRLAEIIAILTAGCVISSLAVTLRIFTRVRLLHTFGPDDAFMSIAQVLTIGAAVAEGLEAKWGLGRHVWMMPQEHYTPFMKSFYSSIIVYNIAVCLVKISILLQYRRIFAGPRMQRLTLIGLVFMTAWTITLAFLLSLVCMPVSAFWDPTSNGRCLNQLAIWYVMAGVNLVTDFSIFSMPLPVINSLQLPKRQKMLLMGVFALGFFTCVVSIFRIHTLKVAADTHDPTWDNVDAATWSFIELTTAVLGACLPTLRPIFARIMPRFFATSRAIATSTNPNSAYLRATNSAWPTGKVSIQNSSMIKDSDSTEGLNQEYRMEDLASAGKGAGAAYTVTVFGGAQGSDPDEVSRNGDSNMSGKENGWGIKTTTIVSQKVEIDPEAAYRRSD